ncbi:acyl-CoA dehydrogenase family protein [Sciscionella sediminilitoris]|uniref:acyl-CoA dehydrogenase family protein n=1 Tax=Sciscionella sediminilitoris TaxID=1445613 RepID=UPI0004DF285E|nr:acyl-CoA dehydrogenase family protein [Sciscionella sp. SE31]
MSELDLLYTGIEEDLRATVRDALADRCDTAAVTAVYDGDRSLIGGLWKTLAVDLGLAGLLVPEDRGGAGATAREAAVVLEELGRAVAPVPFLTSAVLATTALRETEKRAGAELLADLAAGECTAALTVALSTAPDGELPPVRADGGRLHGTVTSVAGVLEAEVLLVPATTGDGLALFAVAAGEAGREPVVCLDMTRQLADVTLRGTPGTLVLGQAEPAVRHALRTTTALLAAEQVGIARWCLEETVAYLKQRRQFGRIVGGFQALKHRLADLAAGVDGATSAARYAAATLAAGDPDSEIAATIAQAYCGDFAVTAAEEAIQLHGGIGMTWEHPAHLYLKRAKADQLAFGTPGQQRTKLAELIELPGPR